MLEAITNLESLASLLALAALEIVLGIDNIVFIAIMVRRLPEAQRKLGYRLGLGGALVTRLLLLFTLAWIAGLKDDWFSLFGQSFSGRDVIMLIGVLLVAEGFGQHVSKGYIYFAMGFSLLVELLNMRYRTTRKSGPLDTPTALAPDPPAGSP